jgi:hypothetical protein
MHHDDCDLGLRQDTNRKLFLKDNEVSSCWVPISFDQGARDPNLTVLPVATPYNGPALYQGPVVYSTEQFTNPPAIAGQVAQYPVGAAYPTMGYTYPVNGK